MVEYVVHPDHYNVSGRLECWTEFERDYGFEYTIVWCLMTARKYLYRHGLKVNNSSIQDIQKANQYIEKAKEIALRNWINFDTTENDNLRKLYNETIVDYLEVSSSGRTTTII